MLCVFYHGSKGIFLSDAGKGSSLRPWASSISGQQPNSDCLQKSYFSDTVVQTVKNPPAMWETWVLSLGWEDPLEEGMETRSSILAWRIPSTEEPGGLQSMGSQRIGHDWATEHTAHMESFFLFLQLRKKAVFSSNFLFLFFVLNF